MAKNFRGYFLKLQPIYYTVSNSVRFVWVSVQIVVVEDMCLLLINVRKLMNTWTRPTASYRSTCK